ncbi:MmcQ/YjbR family DNA-binding protein [Frondihabitans peucedani]|uniref:MmcQ/YjbR family DNA-binding protein n=1 Tax=Frondihabitans peucedani TaxID=598626 RepID=A0ABP8E1E7_9MICO
MNREQLRRHALSFDGAGESSPWAPDRLVFKASNGKVFAVLSGAEWADDQVTLKLPPEEVSAVRETFAGAHPAYKLNKRTWVNLSLEADVPDDRILEMLNSSFAAVASASGKSSLPGL